MEGGEGLILVTFAQAGHGRRSPIQAYMSSYGYSV